MVSDHAVLGAGDAAPPELHPGASECAPSPSICFHGPWGKFMHLPPPASLPPVQKKGRTAHVFAAQGGHTPNFGALCEYCFACGSLARFHLRR